MGLFKKKETDGVVHNVVEETKIKQPYRHILVPLGGVALVGTTTAAIAIPLMVKKIATETATKAFQKIVPMGGPSNNLLMDKPITYVAVGDSITAGYNGFVHNDRTRQAEEKNDKLDQPLNNLPEQSTDYLSFADFLASNLNKKGMLKEYRNFGVSGNTIPQTRQLLLRDQGNLSLLKKANLISLSVGANDFLAAVEVLKIPFWSLTHGGASATTDTMVTDINDARDKILENFGKPFNNVGEDNYYTKSPSGYASMEATKKLVSDSFDELVAMTKSGNLAGLLSIEKELYDKVFGLIQLDLATLINEIHQASPDAKIELIGNAYPFHRVLDTIVDTTVPEVGKSILGAFNQFLETLKATVASANFADYFDVNGLKEFSEDSDKVTFKNLEGEDVPTELEWDRAMPNVLDIHPSTYGHQIIAGHLFEKIMKEAGEKDLVPFQSVQKLDPVKDKDTIESLEKIYTYAGIDKGFEIIDEHNYDNHKKLEGFWTIFESPELLKTIGTFLGDSIDGKQLGQHYQEIFSAFSDNDKSISEKISAVIDAVQPMLKKNETESSKFLRKIVSDIKNLDLSNIDFTDLDFSSLLELLQNSKSEDILKDLIATLCYISNATKDSSIATLIREVLNGILQTDNIVSSSVKKWIPLLIPASSDLAFGKLDSTQFIKEIKATGISLGFDMSFINKATTKNSLVVGGDSKLKLGLKILGFN